MGDTRPARVLAFVGQMHLMAGCTPVQPPRLGNPKQPNRVAPDLLSTIPWQPTARDGAKKFDHGAKFEAQIGLLSNRSNIDRRKPGHEGEGLNPTGILQQGRPSPL